MLEKFTVGGVVFYLSKEEVERKLKGTEPENIREFFVEVNDVKYPIKQALSAVTGLLRGGFTTHDAMRVFRKLSIPVQSLGIDVNTMSERCYTMLKSLNEFDKQEVARFVEGVVTKGDRDSCFQGSYYRARLIVESLLSLRNPKDFQVIAMASRSLFELAVDIKLIDVVPDAVKKILAFTEVEKLRTARQILKYNAAHPGHNMDVRPHAEFVASEGKRIESERASIWPGVKKITHWSAMDLRKRVELLKAPFDEIYDLEYPRLSWSVHSGLTGVLNMKTESLNMLAGVHNRLAGNCYVILLIEVIKEFELVKIDPLINSKLDLAEKLPFTTGPDMAAALEQELLG
jgi:hypothetical protein